MSVTAFADELEREKTRQRVYDAMSRKARAGYVTGGRVFGYHNVEVAGADGKRSHVERRIYEPEAAIIRRMFELCAQGYGKTRIAKTLNAEQAPAPRPQQGRPNAWAPSSVHEALNRPLYRGEVVWNRTKKRDAWGQKRPTDRPSDAWMRREAPELRIVPEDLWRAARARLDGSRAKYLRGTDGRLYGRARDVESPYLLSGFCRCARCGGGFSVVSRAHGKRRAHFYGCASYHKRGQAVCANGRIARLEAVNTAVLQVFEEHVLRPDVVAGVVERCLASLAPEATLAAETQLRRELASVDGELTRLADAIAQGGNFPALLEALHVRQRRRAELEIAINDLSRRVVRVDRVALSRTVEKRLRDWHGLLRRHVPAGRQLFRKLLHGPILFEPAESAGYRFRGEISYGKLFAGALPVPTNLASLTGFEPLWSTGEMAAA